MADFIPTQDANFMAFAQAFATEISRVPFAYGIGPADVATINQAVAAYVKAFERAKNNATRTPGALSDKEETRNACRDLIRMYAQQFRSNMGISTQALIDVGVQRRSQTLGKRTCPQTSPSIGFKARTPGHDELTYSDALAVANGSGRKPHGAERLELFAAYDHNPDDAGELPPPDAIYLGSFRRSPMLVPHGSHAKDGEPTYWGRWAGHNDDVGPWSLPATFRKVRAAPKAATNVPAAADDQSLRLAA